MTLQTAPTSPHRSHTARPGAVTAVVCLALAAVVAAMSSLNVALPGIARATHASLTQLSWVIDAYSLMFAALLLPAGALADKYGRRLALIVGLVVFATASAMAMLVTSATGLIALRGVMGLGAALVMPATLSTITGSLPPAQRTRAVSIWAGVAGASAVVGVVCAGALLELFSWRSVFGLNVVLAAIALVGVLLVVPESADDGAPRLDARGAALAVLGLVALVYSIIEAPTAGWLSARTLVGLAVGVLVLVGFVLTELHTPHPMLDPRIFTHRRLSAGSISISVQFFAFFGFIFLVLQYLQIVRGDSALRAALSMLPMAASMIPASRLAPGLAERYSTRRVCVSGLTLIGAAMIVIAQVNATTTYWLLAGGLVVLGAGMGAAMTPATSAITSALPAAQQGVASAINDLAREVGGALGIAVLGSVMAASYRSQLTLPGVPTDLANQARDSLAVASHLGGPVAAQADIAFISGFHVALYAAAAAAMVAAAAVAALLRKPVTVVEELK